MSVSVATGSMSSSSDSGGGGACSGSVISSIVMQRITNNQLYAYFQPKRLLCFQLPLTMKAYRDRSQTSTTGTSNSTCTLVDYSGWRSISRAANFEIAKLQKG
eukprot:m.110697 g.110697  ORF g.110697 m.110697 type:complete len:103 (-) comp28061_c1_seq2:1062-1370(-)